MKISEAIVHLHEIYLKYGDLKVVDHWYDDIEVIGVRVDKQEVYLSDIVYNDNDTIVYNNLKYNTK